MSETDVTDSGRRVGDPCEAIEAVFAYGPVTCMATSVAVVVDATWGTTHVACAEHAGTANPTTTASVGAPREER